MAHTHWLTAEAFDSRLNATLATWQSHWSDFLDQFGSDVDPLRVVATQMTSGGKRMRAAFCYWSYRAHGGLAGGARGQAVLAVGAGLELFQAAALLHDDVIDDSDRRRGMPAAHRSFAQMHRTNGWRGDSAAFGRAAAILAGDMCLTEGEALAHQALMTLPTPLAARARDMFDTMRSEVAVGQYLDVLGQVLPFADAEVELHRALRVVRTKAARYSVQHPVCIGAALAGANSAQISAAEQFALPVGEAFQLRDDLLGVFGSHEVTGKPAGDDLREGKRTVLVALALARLDRAGKDELTGLLGRPDLAAAQIDTLRDLLTDCGARAAVEDMIAERAGAAHAALERIEWAEPGGRYLAELVADAMDRVR